MRALAVLLLLAAAPAHAESIAAPATRAVVGVFAAFCIPHAGAPDDLRAAVARAGARRMPPEAERFLLHGRTGEAFDMSALGWHFALVSEDNGFCSAYAERADLPLLMPAFEAELDRAGLPWTIAREQPDPRQPGLVDRDYHVTRGGRQATYVVSVDSNPRAPLQALLTASPWHTPKPGE